MNLPKKLNSVNPLVLGDILFRKNKRLERFLSLGHDERIATLMSLTPRVKRELVRQLPITELVGILESIDPDDATDILQLLGKHKREKALLLLSQDLKSSISTLLEFDAETAAGLMTLDYIQADTSEDIASVAKKFQQHEKRTGRPPIILATENGKLAGFIPGHQFGLASKHEKVKKFVKHIPAISYAAGHDAVVHLFQTNPHSKVAVLNDAGESIGIIYSDDVLKLLQEQESTSLYEFAGINREESVTDSAKHKVKNRYRWLIINLGTAFLAAFTVGQFEDTLSKYVLLAVYMPIVAGMGGNAATQTLAVLVRGIALRQIELRTAFKTLRNEVLAGFVNGVINAVLVALVVIIVNQDYQIAFILALAMIANLLVAAIFGTLVPLIMSKLGKDPAASATIFITTATDVLGFLAFLGLATAILT